MPSQDVLLELRFRSVIPFLAFGGMMLLSTNHIGQGIRPCLLKHQSGGKMWETQNISLLWPYGTSLDSDFSEKGRVMVF